MKLHTFRCFLGGCILEGVGWFNTIENNNNNNNVFTWVKGVWSIQCGNLVSGIQSVEPNNNLQ